MKRIIIFGVIVALVLAAAGYWYWQRNPYSKDILKLEILGPDEAMIAQEVEYTVKYKNNGNVRLEDTRLVFEFPEHSVVADATSTRVEVKPEDLGDIYPGEEKTFTFKGRLFGQEGEVKTAKVTLSYRPKNLSSRYDSSTTFTTLIKSVPLTFDFDLPSKVETGRDFKFSLNYFSSLDYPLTNLEVQIEYPTGFEFTQSNPKGLGQADWLIPLVNKAEGGRIDITGLLQGEISEQKIFKATLGIRQDGDFILLKDITRGVEITKPGLSVIQQINGSDQYIPNPGDVLHYEIFFRNIGEEPFMNLFLVARLNGRPFDFDSVRSDVGQFNKGDQSIIWDWRNVQKLKFLGQGEEGKVEFWINLKQTWPTGGANDKNFTVKNNVLISQTTQEFETKVNSELAIAQKGYFKEESFANAGSIPPSVGNTTTYTILWQVKNYYNDVKNVRVAAVLPPNVRLTGKISPQEETSKFAFDNQSREITWRVSDGDVMAAGTGTLNPPRQIAFQVALTPTGDQRGQAAPLIGEATVSGYDQWTEHNIEGKTSAVNTNIPDDPTVAGQGTVQ